MSLKVEFLSRLVKSGWRNGRRLSWRFGTGWRQRLPASGGKTDEPALRRPDHWRRPVRHRHGLPPRERVPRQALRDPRTPPGDRRHLGSVSLSGHPLGYGHVLFRIRVPSVGRTQGHGRRSEEHTSELQSLMRISYAVFCLKKKI